LAKLTPEEIEILKKQFLRSSLGKFLLKIRPHVVILLGLIAFAEFIDYIIGTFLETSYVNYTNNFWENIVIWHIKYHHMLDILMFGIFPFIMVPIIYKYGKTPQVSHNKNLQLLYKISSCFLWAALFEGVIISIHEYSWWISYIVDIIIEPSKFFTLTDLLYFSNSLAIIYSLLIFTFLMLMGFNKRFWLWLILVEIYYSIWILVYHFVISWGYTGPTIYIYNYQVNGIEVGSWIWIFSTFVLIIKFWMIKRRWI
jgi:hypothetical protein